MNPQYIHLSLLLLRKVFKILLIITLYIIFLYYFGDVYLCESVSDSILPDTTNFREEEGIDENRSNAGSCNCSHCTCSNPSLNSITHNARMGLYNKYKEIGRRKLY